MTIERIFHHILDLINVNKDHLTELDTLMGDGDAGLTMWYPFSQAYEEAARFSERDLGRDFSLIEARIAKSVPSTLGTLVGSGFMSAGRALSGRDKLDVDGVPTFLTAFVDGITRRGKASPGEKTIADSLRPAAQALATHYGRDSHAALAFAVEASRSGLEATRGMESKRGRSIHHKEQSAGHEDPGALVGTLIIHGIAEALDEAGSGKL